MTLGLGEAARSAGSQLDVRLAIDMDPEACAVYERNIDTPSVVAADVRQFFDRQPGEKLSTAERRVAQGTGPVDILLGGPPCQGHSDLNNHTRRSDPRNTLYLLMARAAEVLRPRMILIENVPPVLWDSARVVERTARALECLGYRVNGQVVDFSLLGVPQHRRRFILVGAANHEELEPECALSCPQGTSRRTVRWAIEDLRNIVPGRPLDTPSAMSPANARRAQYLLEHDVFDLPNTERPPCHQNEHHSYRSMYGRLRWDQPAQTVTTGFTSMGQGRYMHPDLPRTLTPHEAARLQTLPDWFEWGETASRRSAIARMIGNAVPPAVTFAIGSVMIEHLGRDRMGRRTHAE
jgi:DNA (cytosine-5)-methyltransferase 1